MPEEPSKDYIRYDVLTQEAMLGVVKKVLTETARAGLQGEHHFFISFLTNYPGVRLSSRMRERYPDEMTIVVQHQFWDMKVADNGFEIGLSFDEIPESLSIPFAAIKGFFDPAVQFGLQFDVVEEEDNVESIEPAGAKDGTEIPVVQPTTVVQDPVEIAPKKLKPASKSKPKSAKKTGKSPPDKKQETGADVVSLDSFRKKP